MNATISVVIPTHNRIANLSLLFPPLLKDPATLEVVVVDDGGSDGSFDWLQSLSRRDPRVRPIRIQNSGEGRARQAGATAATGDIVLFLDDDVLAGDGLVSGHLAAHNGRTDLVILGYMPVSLEPRRVGAATRLYAREYERRIQEYIRDPGGILDHLWAGNVSLFRRQAVSLPMFCDEFAGLYFPDRELGIRCTERNLVGFFSRCLAATHLHERSTRDFFRDALRQGAGRVALKRLHPELLGVSAHPRLTRLLPHRFRQVICGVIARPTLARWTLRAGLSASALAARTGDIGLENGVLLVLRRIGWILGSSGQQLGRLDRLLAELSAL